MTKGIDWTRVKAMSMEGFAIVCEWEDSGAIGPLDPLNFIEYKTFADWEREGK